MSLRQWLRNVLETPEERARRRRMEFRARMYENPGKTLEEHGPKILEELRRYGFVRDDSSSPSPPAA